MRCTLVQVRVLPEALEKERERRNESRRRSSPTAEAIVSRTIDVQVQVLPAAYVCERNEVADVIQ